MAMIDRNGTILELPYYIMRAVVLVHGKYLVSETRNDIVIFRQNQQDIVDIVWSDDYDPSVPEVTPMATYKNKTICLTSTVTSYQKSSVIELLDTSWIKKLEFLIASYLETLKICNIHFNFK
jgi:hypothetical protein